jgi:Arc/MetJ family transcription regulator
MKKTSLYIDEDRLAAAGKLLGTSTATDTVNAALTELVARDMRRQLIDRFRSMDPADAAAIERSWE